MRQMHPFPIFERFISTDLTAPADDTLSAKSSSPSSVSVSGCPCSGRMNADISVSKHSAHSAAAVSTHDSRGSNEDNSGNGSHSDSNGIDMEDDNESTELDSDYYPQKPVHTHTSSKSTSNTSSTHTHATRANVQAHAQATASSNPATANTNIVKNTAADSSFQPASHAHPSTHTTQSSAFPTPSSERTEKGRVLIPGNTQVVMFPSDWRENKSWPVFGAGKRACPGKYLTVFPLLLFLSSLSPLDRQFHNYLLYFYCYFTV